MPKNVIEMNGKKIDLGKLSDEQLVDLYKNIQKQESKLSKIISQYQEKYPFLKDIK